MPVFTLTAIDRRTKSFYSLPLTNGGGIAFLRDHALTLRHNIDDDSPFADPGWKSNLQVRRDSPNRRIAESPNRRFD